MTINALVIIFLILALICALSGVNKGMLRTIFSLIAWILLLWFINYSSPLISAYIVDNTAISQTIESQISDSLKTKYDNAELKEAGSGQDRILLLIPSNIKNEISDTIEDSVDTVIEFVAKELTQSAVNGLSVILALVVGFIIIKLIDLILKAVTKIPGLSALDRVLGLIVGLVKGLLLIWLILFIADCFPATALGSYIISSCQDNSVLLYLYEYNGISNIIKL